MVISVDKFTAVKMQEIIGSYNAGSSSADDNYVELMKFTEALKEEKERHIREGLSYLATRS